MKHLKTKSTPTRSWREENDVIYFSVTSDGTTGEDWVKRLEGNGFRAGDYAKQVLRSPDFKPTNGVTTEVAVLKGMLFEDNDRITKKIRAEADKRKLSKPNAELACLIREKFTDKEIEAMGLWYIVAVHEPINDSDGDPSLLSADRGRDGCWLNAYGVRPGSWWPRDYGFAFAVSQKAIKVTNAIEVTRDLETNVIYCRLKEYKITKTIPLEGYEKHIILDLGENREIVGVEILLSKNK